MSKLPGPFAVEALLGAQAVAGKKTGKASGLFHAELPCNFQTLTAQTLAIAFKHAVNKLRVKIVKLGPGFDGFSADQKGDDGLIRFGYCGA